jgi:uncharacterized glyoxalase superfamily protein PhnB
MTDPLDVLRDPIRPVDPDPGFAATLRERLEALLLAPHQEEPPVTVTDTAPLTPYLAVPDAAAALDFYERAFGAVRRGTPITMADGRIGHAEILVGGALVMLADEFPEMGLRAPAPQQVSVSLRLEVPDPDAVVERAARLGAVVERPVTDSPYGRGGVVVDPAGHRWMVSRGTATVGPGELDHWALWTPDVVAAERFYGEVLETAPPVSAAEQATLFCRWAVPDVDAAVAAVRAAGGTAEEPVDSEDGRVADCTDDQGLRFALTTPSGPARDTTAPGELAYVTLRFPDTLRARAFYGTVLGWRFTPGREPGHWNVAETAAGIAEGAGPTAVPMFAVPDVRAAAALVRDAGGTATDPAFAGYGTSTDCRDDQGAPFWLTEFQPR